MGTLLSTNHVQAEERFSYWCDLICNVFVQLDAAPLSATRSFHGSIRNNHLAFVQFSDVIANPQQVIRSKSQIAKSTEDYILISFQRSGEGRLSQDGREVHLQPSDWAIYDSTRPYELTFTDDFEQLVLQLPRQTLQPHLSLTEDLTARLISGKTGLGHVTYNFVTSTWQQLDQLDEDSFKLLADTTVDLLVASLQNRCLKSSPPLSNQSTKVVLIKAFINKQLRNPQLSVEMIAKALHLSPRYLHRLFQHEGTTIARFIRMLRLEKCREELMSLQQAHRSITEIAFSWGFNNAAHFSHLFKKQYGLSARAYRQQHGRFSQTQPK